MNLIMFMYLAFLAFLLSPGVLIRLPPRGSPTAVAVTHAVVLSLVWGVTHTLVYKAVA